MSDIILLYYLLEGCRVAGKDLSQAHIIVDIIVDISVRGLKLLVYKALSY